MKYLTDIITEIMEICKQHPVMEDRIEALQQEGFGNINYHYMKGYNILLSGTANGLFKTMLLPKKRVYRIQIGYTERQKGYPAAWCLDLSSINVEYEVELPF